MARDAWREARNLGHSHLGPEHEVLAILAGPEDEPARAALEACGVDHDTLVARLAAVKSWPPPEPRDGISPNPLHHEVMGWARGFAASRAEALRRADVLLAVVWHERASRTLFDDNDATRPALVSALKERGVTVPPGPLPAIERYPCPTYRVGIQRDRLSEVLERLERDHPPGKTGAHWGFNYDWRYPDRAYVIGDDSIDIGALLTDVGVEVLEYVPLPEA